MFAGQGVLFALAVGLLCIPMGDICAYLVLLFVIIIEVSSRLHIVYQWDPKSLE